MSRREFVPNRPSLQGITLGEVRTVHDPETSGTAGRAEHIHAGVPRLEDHRP
ncbi:hypothetical protein [Streptomyces sp. NPDC058084]|uniref:hypothetical protein n=1 Tax=Streptomyces sp. NPDC058084 TaxID=3346333 RepID=UPI0036E2D601